MSMNEKISLALKIKSSISNGESYSLPLMKVSEFKQVLSILFSLG